jgi:hypothetical protein
MYCMYFNFVAFYFLNSILFNMLSHLNGMFIDPFHVNRYVTLHRENWSESKKQVNKRLALDNKNYKTTYTLEQVTKSGFTTSRSFLCFLCKDLSAIQFPSDKSFFRYWTHLSLSLCIGENAGKFVSLFVF